MDFSALSENLKTKLPPSWSAEHSSHPGVAFECEWKYDRKAFQDLLRNSQ